MEPDVHVVETVINHSTRVTEISWFPIWNSTKCPSTCFGDDIVMLALSASLFINFFSILGVIPLGITFLASLYGANDTVCTVIFVLSAVLGATPGTVHWPIMANLKIRQTINEVNSRKEAYDTLMLGPVTLMWVHHTKPPQMLGSVDDVPSELRQMRRV